MQKSSINFIVPCMGRLDFVKQTIGPALAQPDSTYTLVDYSCPQHTGDWVEAHYPSARVVRAEGRTRWYPAEARNMGARDIPDGWLCFLDSDIIVHPEFSQTVLAMAEPGTYFHAPQLPGVFGTMLCAKTDFDKIGGYDEVLRPYGGEDVEIKMSLNRIGLKPVQLPEWLLKHIDHDDSLRTENCDIKEKIYTELINGLYVFVKDSLLRGGATYDRPTLETLYRFSRERFLVGYPWLSWPEPDAMDPSKFGQIFQTLAEIGCCFESVTAEAWGSIRTFALGRTEGPMLEILTTANRQTVNIRAAGLESLTVKALTGETTELTLVDGQANLALTAEPVFIVGQAELVKDVAVEIAPLPGPAIALTLTQASGFSGPVDIVVSVGDSEVYRGQTSLTNEAVRLQIPVARSIEDEAHGLPLAVTVDYSAAGRRYSISRRTTFYEAVKVTVEESGRPTPPAHRSSGLPPLGKGRAGEGYGLPLDGDDAPDVAVGWTETDLVCWVSWRSGPSPLMGDSDCDEIALIAIDPDNSRAHFGSGIEVKVNRAAGRIGAELRKSYLDPIRKLPDAVTIGATPEQCMSVRIPFDLLGIEPSHGGVIGAAIRIAGAHTWGGGFGNEKSPRLYNEITLAD